MPAIVELFLYLNNKHSRGGYQAMALAQGHRCLTLPVLSAGVCPRCCGMVRMQSTVRGWVTPSGPARQRRQGWDGAEHAWLGIRLHNPSGQPGPGLRHPQREEVLPQVQLELPLLQFVPIAPCPVAGHH